MFGENPIREIERKARKARNAKCKMTMYGSDLSGNACTSYIIKPFDQISS